MLRRLLPLSLALAMAPGCWSPEPPRLLGARFMDENEDGEPQPGETILLTFSGGVRVARDPVTTGVDLLPASSTPGAYELRQVDQDHQLALVLGVGDLRLNAHGRYGNPETPHATGLSIDYERCGGLVNPDGDELTGNSGPVDLEVTSHPAAVLERAHWLDTDRSSSVNDGDLLRLKFDREVQVGAGPRSRQMRVPADLLHLPVEGNLLAAPDADPPALLRASPEGGPRCIDVVLGVGTRLSVHGAYSHTARFTGSPSGVSILGSSVRPHPAIIDRFEVGVMGLGAIDIESDCSPFHPLDETPLPPDLSSHASVALPDGRVVVIGGLSTPSARSQPGVSGAIWIYDDESQQWTPVGRLRVPRCNHTATFLAGEEGPEDDIIVIAGGHDRENCLGSVEILLIGSGDDPPRLVPDVRHASQEQPAPRSLHTAHAISDANSDRHAVVLVGGLLRAGTAALNPIIEVLEVRVTEQGGKLSAELVVSKVGRLHHARYLHDSVAIEEPGEPPRILVFGGFGAVSFERNEVPIGEPHGQVLDSAEVLSPLSTAADGVTLALAGGSAHPTPRHGHRLVALSEEDWSILLVGGTSALPAPHAVARIDRAHADCREAVRIRLDLSSARPSIAYRRVGALLEERTLFGCALLDDGTVLVAGGTEAGEATRRVELFNPTSDQFETFCKDLLTARSRHSITRLIDGDWLLVGGGAGAGPAAEVFAWED